MARTVKIVDDRNEQIMDAALRIFAKKGYSEATIKDIAQEAGITPGLIYHYFENKEALFKAIFENRSPLHLIRSIPSEILDLPPEDFLRYLVAQVLTIVEDERFMQLLRVYLPEAIHHPDAAPFGLSAISEATRFLEGYLVAKMTSGELLRADADLTSQLFLGSIMDFALRRQVLKDPRALVYTQEQIVDNLVNQTLRGLLPR